MWLLSMACNMAGAVREHSKADLLVQALEMLVAFICLLPSLLHHLQMATAARVTVCLWGQSVLR